MPIQTALPSTKNNRSNAILGVLVIMICCCLYLTPRLASSTPTPTATQPIISAPKNLEITIPSPTTQKPTITTTSRIASTHTPTDSATQPPLPTIENTQPPNPNLDCIPTDTKRSTGQVVHIVDGDTIDVLIDGQKYRVRYIGIDTPESTNKIEYFGKEATEANRLLVEGKTVTLVKDVSETDRYDRLLRYVILDDLFVNLELVIAGYATAATYPPDIACQAIFSSAQTYAEYNSAGLWQNAPAPTAAIIPPSAGNCDPSYPTVCIPPRPPDLDCNDISFRSFPVLPPDPHNFDGNHNGLGCESN